MISHEQLWRDILAFQILPSSERKFVVSKVIALLTQIEIEHGLDSQKYKNFLIAVRALDALHHLAKDTKLIEVR